jgi:hypothetical protein
MMISNLDVWRGLDGVNGQLYVGSKPVHGAVHKLLPGLEPAAQRLDLIQLALQVPASNKEHHLKAVLWICDILTLTYGSGFGFCFYCQWLKRCQQKICVFFNAFAFYFFKVHLHKFPS